MPSPVDLADSMRGPILGLFGGADDVVSGEQVSAFDRALDSAGIDHEFVVYPGATHGFSDPTSQQFAAASDDAWRPALDRPLLVPRELDGDEPESPPRAAAAVDVLDDAA
jgi:dienelactone hydrolase